MSTNYTYTIGRLMGAIRSSNVHSVKHMISTGVDVNAVGPVTPVLIMAASSLCKVDILNLLLEAGAEVNVVSPQHTTALSVAVENWRIDAIKLLLEYGADIHFQRPKEQYTVGNQALLLAAANMQHELVAMLLDRGADIEFHKPYLTGTALSQAVDVGGTGSAAMVKLLLERGAQVDTVNNHQWTPLMHAAMLERGEFKEVMELLLQYGADINHRLGGNQRNGSESTPLICAAFNRKCQAAQLLIAHGADTTLKNNNGKNALETAIDMHAHDLVAFFNKRALDQIVAETSQATSTHVIHKRTRL